MFKVVKRSSPSPKLTSVIVNQSKDSCLAHFFRIYRSVLGEAQKVESGFCFDTLENAKAWFDDMGLKYYAEIWSVKYSKKIKVEGIMNHSGEYGKWNVPKGSWKCFDVELLERIY
jgi:hypothetical protein